MAQNQKAMNTKFPIRYAYVLAGGKSRRLGRDKLFVPIEGRPLLERTLRVCREVFPDVKILAREKTKFANFDCAIVLDHPQAQGPLAGIISALEDCSDPACFITAADLCDLDHRVIHELLAEYDGEDYFGLNEGARRQPLCGIYSATALDVLRERAEQGVFDLQSALDCLITRFIPAPTGRWRNINTEIDLKQAARQ